MKLIEGLEREGGHIAALLLLFGYAVLIMSFTPDEATKALCHDVAIGAFSAVLALLKGSGQAKANSTPEETATPAATPTPKPGPSGPASIPMVSGS
ncbi:MAG: hypothetical protein KGL39_22905 [Patescibacteria group bacterium]|nr:hypothetical protein [Patescibacteria group bacterium]